MEEWNYKVIEKQITIHVTKNVEFPSDGDSDDNGDSASEKDFLKMLNNSRKLHSNHINNILMVL